MTSKWRPLTGSSQAIALEVLVAGPLSRSELADRVMLSPASLTRLATPLVESGLLIEIDSPSNEPRIGRPVRPLDIVPTSHHFIGIKLTGEEVTGVVTTLRAEPVASRTLPLVDHLPESVVAVIAEVVDELSGCVPDVDGIGIGVGGESPDGSGVTESPFLEWAGVPLGAMVEQVTGLPVVVENDVTALMEAERWFGAGVEHRTFALLTVGAGIGYSLVIHGDLATDEQTGIGRVGHHPLTPDGPPCPRGHRGCATAMLTTQGIEHRASAGLGRPVTYDQVIGLARAGDPTASAITEESGRALGQLIATIATFSMARVVVLGGEGAALAEVARKAITDGIISSRDPESPEVTVLVRQSDFSEWARGAAVVAIQDFVTSPVLPMTGGWQSKGGVQHGHHI